MDKLRLKRFLTERYRGVNGQIELIIYDTNEGWKATEVKLYGYKNIYQLVNVIYRLNQSKKYHIYLGVHSRWRREIWNMRTKELTALVLEIDYCDYSVHGGPALMEKINSFPLKPSIRVSLGNAMQLYWQFKEPMLKSRASAFQAYQKSLVSHFGCKESTGNYEEVKRPPYVNFLRDTSKSDYPFNECCQMNTDGNGDLLRYELKDFDFILSEVA